MASKESGRATTVPSSSAAKEPNLIHGEWMLIANFIKDNDHWISGPNKHHVPMFEQTAMWKKLAEDCSAIGPAPRNVVKIKKCWGDLKARVRSKYLKHRTSCNKTGGGLPPELRLREYERICLDIMPLEPAAGFQGVDVGVPPPQGTRATTLNVQSDRPVALRSAEPVIHETQATAMLRSSQATPSMGDSQPFVPETQETDMLRFSLCTPVMATKQHTSSTALVHSSDLSGEHSLRELPMLTDTFHSSSSDASQSTLSGFEIGEGSQETQELENVFSDIQAIEGDNVQTGAQKMVYAENVNVKDVGRWYEMDGRALGRRSSSPQLSIPHPKVQRVASTPIAGNHRRTPSRPPLNFSLLSLPTPALQTSVATVQIVPPPAPAPPAVPPQTVSTETVTLPAGIIPPPQLPAPTMPPTSDVGARLPTPPPPMSPPPSPSQPQQHPRRQGPKQARPIREAASTQPFEKGSRQQGMHVFLGELSRLSSSSAKVEETYLGLFRRHVEAQEECARQSRQLFHDMKDTTAAVVTALETQNNILETFAGQWASRGESNGAYIKQLGDQQQAPNPLHRV